MQASILPKPAGREAQKLGFLPLTSVVAFFGRRSARRGVAGRLADNRAVAGIRPLQQKMRNIIPVFVLCNADSVIGCFSSISGYLSGQFTYNAPLNEKTRKRSV